MSDAHDEIRERREREARYDAIQRDEIARFVATGEVATLCVWCQLRGVRQPMEHAPNEGARGAVAYRCPRHGIVRA